MNKSVEEYFIGLFPLFHRKFFRKKEVHGQYDRILFLIADCPGKSMTYYCQKLHISKPNMTKAINGLIELGHVKRERFEGDRRQVKMFITELGQSIVDNRKKEVLNMIRERLAPLSEEDQLALKRHIIGIQEILDKLEG